ncbi:G-type lectin S-receptor-like serine/threonine-protein kinase At1g61370 [Camellia sinensis]|uniref:G-type lectin S-receptor-like serine/threonine-protein kinase At1g61370 n=1 Tax=Camellia sinensis TaxID=4442 RepID=UPI0010365087|nr:G-type lectin S-receptor-like serine/threonine-protein kinase At1g61370 [Camellia sinensis]
MTGFNKNGCPICECLKGFVPKSTEDWSKGNWTGGCVRRTELLCQKNISRLANGTAQNDGFWKLSGLKLPDHFEYLFNQDYSGIDHKKREKITIIFTTISEVVLLGAFMFGLHRWRANQRVKRRKRIKGFGWGDRLDMLRDPSQDHATHSESSELPMLDFDKVLVATNNFSITNKLGKGGFGPVYWHRNLVRLLGYCIDGEEKLLVYEYMTNRSLDMFLFDAKKRMQLDWAKRFNIIQGIARGILYLHCDSCLRVIHRDLKASNILLDDDMNPKISDFGLARTFQLAQELANTHRVMGTL